MSKSKRFEYEDEYEFQDEVRSRHKLSRMETDIKTERMKERREQRGKRNAQWNSFVGTQDNENEE